MLANIGFAMKNWQVGRRGERHQPFRRAQSEQRGGAHEPRRHVRKLGAFDKAIAHYEAAIRTDAKRGDAYSGVARCMTEKGNIAGAKKYCQEAIATDPSNADAHWQLGNILWKKENKQAEALKEYEISVKLDENSQVFYENLALLQEEMGKKDIALATWKKYLIYLNEAIKKKRSRNASTSLKTAKPSPRPEKRTPRRTGKKASQANEEHMQQMKSDLRRDSKTDAKRLDTKSVDVGSDFDKIGKDTGEGLDLRKEAKKKSEAK